MRGTYPVMAMMLLATLAGTRLAAQDAAAAGPTVEAAVGTGVQDRQLQGGAESFPASVGKVYCFTKIGKTAPGAEFEHVWYHGTDEVGRVKLTAQASPWRTYSSKNVPPEATGDWRVDVVQDGKVLKSVSFKVQ